MTKTPCPKKRQAHWRGGGSRLLCDSLVFKTINHFRNKHYNFSDSATQVSVLCVFFFPEGGGGNKHCAEVLKQIF